MFKNKLLKKVITIVFLVIHTVEIFASNLILDPNSRHNAKLDKSNTGVPIVNVSTPNNRGISVNEFLEYNIGKEGQVLNNADNVGRSHLAGLINANPNLSPNQAANLIVLQVNGSNRSQIEGYLEALSREKVNVIMSNENGIYLNNAGTINIKNFTATTGKVKLKDGDFVGIDVKKGNIAIGPKGMDITNANYVELISKTLELAGNLVSKADLKVITGSNKVDKDGNIEKIETSIPASVAIDASQLGGMYAGQIKIISTDKGAGVNSDAFIVSKDKKLEITADGKVKINKVQGKGIDVRAKEYEQIGLAQSDLDINIKANNIKLSGVGTQAEKKIILDGNVENNSAIYTKENLYTKNLKNTSNIQVKKDIQVDGKLVSSGNIKANDKILIASSAENIGNISTGSSFTAQDTKTKGKLIVKDNIDVRNFTNEGIVATEAKLNIDKNLKNTGEIKAINNIKVSLNTENTGDILTDGSFTSKDVRTTKKLIAKNKVEIGNLINDGELTTNSSLIIDGKLENAGNIKANDKITIASNVNNNGNILTNSTFTAKDTKTTKKLIVNDKIDVANLKNTGELATNSSLTIDGKLENKGNIKVKDKIIVASDVNNEGEILTNSTFTSKDTRSTKSLVAASDITVNNLDNSGTLVTNKKLTVDGNLKNEKLIQVKESITVSENVDNIGDILTNSSFSAKDVKTNKKLIALGNISTSSLINNGELATRGKLKVDGTLDNSENIQVGKDISISSSVDNTGEILTEGKFTSKDVKTTKSLVAKGKIDIENLINDGLVATDSNLNIKGKLVNTKDIKAADKISVASSVNNNGNILTNSTFTAKDLNTSNKLIAVGDISISNLVNSGKLATQGNLLINGALSNSDEIQVAKNINISSNVENIGNILTDGSFSAKNIKTTKKLLAKGKIEIANLENSGELGTNSSLIVNGKLENKGNIQVVDKISVSSSAQNDGKILTNSSFTAKDTKNTNSLIAVSDITVNNLNNSGTLVTNKKLTVDGNLKNEKLVQAKENIIIFKNIDNTGDILTNSTLSAKDVKTTKKLIALGDISTSNLINSGELAIQGKLKVDGSLDNSKKIQAGKDISIFSSVNNTGDILTDGKFTSKDVKTTKSLVAKDKIDIGNLQNDGLVATNSNLNIKGKLINTKDIKADKEITVALSANNSGEILTNSSFSAKDTINTNKLIAVDKITVKNLTNDGNLATNSTLTVDGALKNTKNIHANDKILISSSTDNSGNILTNSSFTAKDTKNTKKIIAKDNIKTSNLTNTDIVATDGSLKVAGNLNNSGNISAVKEIKIGENTNNTGIILTNSSFSAKDIKTTNKLVAIGEINTKGLVNEGDLATKAKLNVDGSLSNKKNIQAVNNITVSSNVQNDGTILTDANFSSKDIVNTKTLISRENISSGTLDNFGIFSAGKDLKVRGSINNSKTIEATNIDIIGENLANSSSIKADNIFATVKATKNDGEILALKDITLNTKKLDNTKKIAALQNITANKTILINSGEIVSNKKIELNNSNITNTNKILSNIIDMKNTSNFNNTGTISGTDVTLTSEKDINLVGNLHGENSLVIEGKNIVNNGKTTGKNLISIKSNDFTNKKELSSKDLKIIASGDILNENILSAKDLNIKAKNLTNNDLIAAENNANINVINKVTNTKTSSIYAGNKLNIKASEILNDSSEILGTDIKLEANHITNHIGILQALNNMHIKAGKFENIGEVEDLDRYESYYETWDEKIIEANQIGDWKIHFSEGASKRGSGSSGNKVRKKQREAYNEISERMKNNKYSSLLFPKYDKLMRSYLGDQGEHTEKTGSTRIKEVPLKEKLRSLGKTTHAKVLAGNNITIVSDEVLNKDAIISAENTVKIDADKVENLVSVGDEKIKVKTGQEIMLIKFERKKRKLRPDRIRMNVTYTRDFVNDYITKKIPKLDENGNQVYKEYGFGKRSRRRKVYETITEYVGRYAHVTGQPSVIEGKNVVIDNASLVRQGIEEANGYIKSGKNVNIQNFTSKNFNTGFSNVNQKVNFNLSRTNNPTINLTNPLDNTRNNFSNIENPVTNINNNLKINSKLNNYEKMKEIDNITNLTTENVKNNISISNRTKELQNIDTNTKKIEIFSNMDSIKEILRSGKIDTLPNLPSSLFIKNLEPSAKYIMETRLKHIALSSYYGSDYFLNKVGYEEKWDRVKRLGDAFYENQLVERSIIEKLGTRFLNGTAISMKQLIDNASIEAPKLNLVIGQALTKEQISSLDKDIVWYEYQDVSGLKVLAPKVYLSKNTLANIKADGRSRIEGTELTSIKAKNVDNAGVIGNKGTTYIEADSITNRSIGDQIAEITGDKTTLVAENDIFNIGSKISATDELNLISKNGNILNQSTITETNRNYGDLNRTRHTELENIAEISSNNKLNIIADNYTSIAAKTNAKELDIVVKEDVNISSQKLSGEQKFGKDGSNFNAYAFESNMGSNVNAENINIDAKNLNITGSVVLAKEAVLDVDKVNIDSNVDKVDTESRSKSKGFLSSKSKVEMQHNETNVAGTLYVEDKATINGDVNVVGSNLVLGKDSYVDGSLTTDSKATYNKYILEEKKKGFSFDLSSNSFNLSYGKNQFNYDEKDKTNIKSNLVLGDGTVLNKGAEITATNFSHGDIEVNNGDVVYGARKDERDVKISTKSSSFGISANVSSPALERIKQGANALEQIGNGDALGGLVNIGNAVTGTVEGLAGNQGTKQNANSGATRTKDEINNAKANNNFYVGASINAGYSKSKQESKSHNEKAVVTNITGLDENAKITYNDNKNVKYQGTQASDTTFVYNNVENITKEAVETNNYYKTKGNSFGVGVSAGISGSNEVSVSVNASASVNKLNSEQTIYENGKFTNVNEVHNKTGTMKLSGFNQEGGTVTGSIKKLEIESLQNTSKTDGYTAGGNISVGITNAGAVNGNVHGSLTDGDRAFVDNQSTFVVGENSNLKIGNVDNTASIIGTTDNGKISIENYTGRNLENSDKLTTVGGSVGTSGVGISYSNSEKEGITRNTVVGNVEIEKSSGDTINRDLSKANEITKDSSTSTNVYAESQLVNAVQNPNDFKEKTSLANQELKDLKNTVLNTIENKGKDNRNFIELLNNQRRATTLNNLLGNDISNILENSDNIQEDFSNLIENFGKDLGIDIKVNYTDTKGMPLESKDKGGTARLNRTNGEIYINTDRIKNTSELVGTVFEELSHIIDGVAGRQDKEVAETTDEKGLESLGRPVNDYFVETYKEDSKEISLVSDKKDYTNAGGVNVGDFDPISAGTVYISTLLSSSDLELDLMSLADSGSELVANPSLGTGAVFAIDLIGTALPGVQATVIRRGGEVLLKAVDGTVYKVVGKSADEILKIIGDSSVGKTTVKLADDVLEKLSSVINKVDSKIDNALGLTVKNADSSATKVGVEVVEKIGKNLELDKVIDNATKTVVSHSYKGHSVEKLAEQLSKRPYESMKEYLRKNTFFNPSWSETEVKNAADLLYKTALNDKFSQKYYEVTYLGEKVTGYFEGKTFKSLYGNYKLTYEQLLDFTNKRGM